MFVHRSNFLIALYAAIEAQSCIEEAAGYRTDSALLSGWRGLAEYLEAEKPSSISFYPE